MKTALVDGRVTARQVREEVAAGVRLLVGAGGAPPGLATVLVGDDPASQVYVRSKRKACTEAGMVDVHRHLPGNVTRVAAAAVLDELAAGPAVSGILLQLPVPAHLDHSALVERIPASKDVDAAGVMGVAGRRPPVPGGVGPMTIAMLLFNTLTAARARAATQLDDE